jgi:hypothetical protein
MCSNGMCGGAGATCQVDAACATGRCCNNVCCGANEVCTNEGGCKLQVGEICTSGDQCQFNLCCGGTCVLPDETRCSTCEDVCPQDYICHLGVLACRRPARGFNEICDYPEECTSQICTNGKCCNACGGACGEPQPDGEPCGSESRCCDGFCVSEYDDDNCGICGNDCGGRGVQCYPNSNIVATCECPTIAVCVTDSEGSHMEGEVCGRGTGASLLGYCSQTNAGEKVCWD